MDPNAPTASDGDDEDDYSLGPSNRRRRSYEQQQIDQRSRPMSRISEVSSVSKGKRASYQPPPVSRDVNEELAQESDGQPDYPVQGLLVSQETPNSWLETKDSSVRSSLRKRTLSGKRVLDPLEAPANLPAPDQPLLSSSDRPATRREDRATANRDEVSSESSAIPPLFGQRQPEELMPPPKADVKDHPKWLNEIYVLSNLILFSILGTLARLGVQWLTFYPGAPIVTPVIWANFGGSIIMGFMSEDQALFRSHNRITPTDVVEKRASGRSMRSGDLAQHLKSEHNKLKKSIPFYVGLSTAFCGSFTSFSSFARDMFLALSNNLPSPVYHTYTDATGSAVTATSTLTRNGGYSFMALAGVILMTVILCLGGLILGTHLAQLLDPLLPHISKRFTHYVLDPLVLFLAVGTWLGALFLTIFTPHDYWRGTVLFALLFAPPGCILRYYASAKLNPLVPAFPLGTFAVNMLGTAIEAMCYDIQHVGVGVMGRVGGGRIGCQVLQGVMDGFCGCLTTVSTWVAEIRALKRGASYAYGLASVISGLCLMVVIMGSVRWTVGWTTPVCNTGYPNKIHG